MDKSVCQILVINNIVQYLNIREIGKFMLANKRIFEAVKKSQKFKLVTELYCLAGDKNTANKYFEKISTYEKKWSLREYVNLSSSIVNLFKTHPIISTMASIVALISSPIIIPAIAVFAISNKIKKYKNSKWYYNAIYAMLWVSCTDRRYISITKELLSEIRNEQDEKLIINLCQIAILNDNLETIILLGDKIKHLGETNILMFGEVAYCVGNLKIADLMLDLYKTAGYDLALWNEIRYTVIGMNNCGVLDQLSRENYNPTQQYLEDGFLRACKNTDIKTLLFLTENYNVDVRLQNDIGFIMACKTGNYEIASVLSSLCQNYVLTTATEKNDNSHVKIRGTDLYLQYKII